MKNDEAIYFTLSPAAAERLDKLLAAFMAENHGEFHLSRVRLQDMIRSGCVQVEGEAVTDPAYRVTGAVSGSVVLPPPEPADLVAIGMELAVVYEDDDVLVIDKPAGLVVHPGAGNYDNTLVNGLLHYCGSLSAVGGVLRPGIVHRLDKDTSGLLVVAKNDGAHHGLAEQFAKHTVGRVYTAVVWGVPKPLAGVVDSPIGRHVRDRKRMACGVQGGKRAVTHYKVVELLGEVSVVECRLETGRTHQIRVHLSSLGHALVGDSVYGGKEFAGFGRQALHAGYLSFHHPGSGKLMEFSAEPPEDFKKLLEYAILKSCKKS